MNNDNINDFVPSLLRPRAIRREKPCRNLSLTQNSVSSQRSLSLKRSSNINTSINLDKVISPNKENLECSQYFIPKPVLNEQKPAESISLHLSDIVDIEENVRETLSNPLSINDFLFNEEDKHNDDNNKSVTSDIELNKAPSETSQETVLIQAPSEVSQKTVFVQSVISISFSLKDCDKVDLSSSDSNIKKVSVKHENGTLKVDCQILEGSQISELTDEIEKDCDMTDFTNVSKSSQKRKAAAVNLEIKKQKLTTEQSTEQAKVLILKTNVIEKLTHVIVQPENYKLVKQKIFDRIKDKRLIGLKKNEISVAGCHLKQKPIDTYFRCNVLKKKLSADDSNAKRNAAALLTNGNVCENQDLVRDDAQEMNRNSIVVDVKHDGRSYYTSSRHESPKTPRLQQSLTPRTSLKASLSDVPRIISPKPKRDSAGSLSPRKPVESLKFNLPLKSSSNKTSNASQKNIPNYKIVAGTQFAVDAFSYGDIPNVKHYFLTHFHSDHYTGLKKSFNKLLLCSKITADLCTSRVGVNSKCIQVINIDETIKIEGVEITALDANHCPGAIMLVFTLPNGKSILHTGDCRASPVMESYPVFWNKDIHTVYLDTTYCNPRYDFPTQDQSLELALHILRQKKMALEKAGKKFSSVLIICGTYTIGKEKFFLGIARRVGCSIWACPDRDRVLRAVEGRSYAQSPPRSCQLHVVPMRDLTHEKLRSYMDSMPGAFNEVVAFKPSGWENGKNSAVEKDSVTIHGIPYSEHSSFSELIRFVKFLKPKQVIPTVDIAGGIKAVQKYFPCPLVNKDYAQCQSKLTDFFRIQNQQQALAVT